MLGICDFNVERGPVINLKNDSILTFECAIEDKCNGFTMDCNEIIASNYSNVNITMCQFICNEETSCENANIICGNNIDCNVICENGNYACRYANINASNALNFNLLGQAYQGLYYANITGSKYNNTFNAIGSYGLRYANIFLPSDSVFNYLKCLGSWSCQYAS